MKKWSGIAVLFLLALAFPAASRAGDFKLLFSLGAHLRNLSGYAYHYAIRVNPGNAFYPPEYGLGNDRLGKADVFGPDFSLGISYKNLCLALSFVPFSGNFAGTYDLSVPSTWFYNLIAADRITATSKFSGMSLGIDLKYAFPLGRVVQIYMGGGVHFLWADLELPQDIIFTEYFYRSPDLSYGIHTLDITAVEFTPVSVKTLGWDALGGLEFTPASPYWIFLEVRYQTGKTDIPHPYYSRLDSTAAPIHLDFSGFALSLGIRYALDW